jgi:hypothetical protein
LKLPILYFAVDGLGGLIFRGKHEHFFVVFLGVEHLLGLLEGHLRLRGGLGLLLLRLILPLLAVLGRLGLVGFFLLVLVLLLLRLVLLVFLVLLILRG